MVSEPGGRPLLVAATEAVAVGGAGAGLTWLFIASLPSTPAALAGAAVAASGLNGAISGAKGVYQWRRPHGWVCWGLDSTWGLISVAGGVVLHLINAVYPSSYFDGMSRRTNRHVYECGFTFRSRFAITFGNVVSAGGGDTGLRGESPRVMRRRRLVEVHEGAHVLQNRSFGPLYVLGYAAWLVLAGAAGLVVGLVMDRGNWRSVVETFAYYDNPFEYWAYRKDGYWPPRGAHPRFVWRAGNQHHGP